MQLNKGDRVNYNGSTYEIVAVVMTTVYLRKTENTSSGSKCYEIQEVYKYYRDIEFL